MSTFDIIALVKLLLTLAPEVISAIKKILDPKVPEGNDLPKEIHVALQKALENKEKV